MDLLLGIEGDGGADLVLEGGDLALDPGLRTAVLASLFSDARADADEELPLGETSRRGWWADTPDDRFGSLLWLVAREKATPLVAARAAEYARRSLQWLLDEEIAESVEVTGEFVGQGHLELAVTIARGNATRWSSVWDGELAVEQDVGGVRVHLRAA